MSGAYGSPAAAPADPRSAPHPRDEAWRVWAGALVALHLAVFLLGRDRTLIPDEIRPLLVGERGWRALLEFARQDVVQTPLSYLFHHLWGLVLGPTDAAYKASALAASVPAIVLFTRLAARVTRAWREAAVLFATPFLVVGSSVNLLRMYGLAVLLAVAALVLWERWRRAPGAGVLAGWTAVMALLLWTHPSGLLLLGASVVANALLGPRPWRFALAGTLAGLALVPWVLHVRPVVAERGIEANVAVLRASPHRELFELPFELLSSEDPGGGSPRPPLHEPAWRQRLEPAAALVLVLLALAARRALLAGRPRPTAHAGTARARPREWLWAAGLLWLLPVAVLYLFSLAVTPAISARYLLVSLPATALFLAQLGEGGGRLGRALVVGVLIPWGLVNAGLTLQRHLRRTTVGDVAEVVSAGLAPGDLVLVNKHMPLGWQVHWEWTHRLGRPEPVAIVELPMEPWIASIVPGVRLEELPLAGVQRIWYVHENLKRRRIAERTLRSRGFVVDGELRTEAPALLHFRPVAK